MSRGGDAAPLLSAATIALFILGLGGLFGNEAALTTGLSPRPLPVIEVVLSGLAAWALVNHQRGRAAPLVPLDLLRIRILSLSSLTSICSYVA